VGARRPGYSPFRQAGGSRKRTWCALVPAKFKTPRAQAEKTAVISRYFNLSHNYYGPLREHCSHCASIAAIARVLRPLREYCSHCASIADIARVFQPLRWHCDLLRNNCASSVNAIAGVLTPLLDYRY